MHGLESDTQHSRTPRPRRFLRNLGSHQQLRLLFILLAVLELVTIGASLYGSYRVEGLYSRALVSRQQCRVLVAEDNQVNQTVMVRMLEGLGHVPTVAGDGREALQKLAAAEYDVVLMDVQMPNMDGFEATSAIRAREREINQGRLPVIAMTAHAITGYRKRCLDADMDGYLSEPVRAAELAEVIENVTRSKSRQAYAGG